MVMIQIFILWHIAVLGCKYDYAIDMWSAGCTVYEVAFRFFFNLSVITFALAALRGQDSVFWQ